MESPTKPQSINRCASSRKPTELGYSVILIYLGFPGAEEIRKWRDLNLIDQPGKDDEVLLVDRDEKKAGVTPVAIRDG